MTDARDAAIVTPIKHITDQVWWPEQREDGIYVVGLDGTVILKLCRPDQGSDLLLAGYIVALQRQRLKEPPR